MYIYLCILRKSNLFIYLILLKCLAKLLSLSLSLSLYIYIYICMYVCIYMCVCVCVCVCVFVCAVFKNSETETAYTMTEMNNELKVFLNSLFSSQQNPVSFP